VLHGRAGAGIPMKLNDAVWGALLILFSVAVLVHVQHFPTIPGQKVGPALFPGVLAVALAVCAVILVVKGLAARRHGHERARWAELDGWTKSRRHVIAFVAVIGVNVLYILLVDRIGFIVTGVAYLATLFIVFGVRLRAVLPLALVVTLVIHYAFYKLLKVPLPWGLLQGFAW
jgi:putative tricarboxylic transport membrane protein